MRTVGNLRPEAGFRKFRLSRFPWIFRPFRIFGEFRPLRPDFPSDGIVAIEDGNRAFPYVEQPLLGLFIAVHSVEKSR